MESLTDFKKRFDRHLSHFLDQKLAHYRELTQNDAINALINHSKSLLLGGGKRIRPYMAWLMYQTAGGTDFEAVLPVLLSLEVFHMFCLIHDDVIDKGEARHDVPTMNAFGLNFLHTEARHGDLAHIANSQAILVGDLLFAWSRELFSDMSHLAPKTYVRAKKGYDAMIDEVIIGQMIDVDTTTQNDVSAETIHEKMLLKTARYSFVRPMQIGLALAKDDADLHAFADRFGTNVGLAYQIQDDVLDIVSTADTTHKTVLYDLQNRQHTFLTNHIRHHGTSNQKAELERVFGAKLKTEDIKVVRHLMTESGAIDAANHKVSELLDRAKQDIADAEIPKDYSAAWQAMVSLMEQRQS